MKSRRKIKESFIFTIRRIVYGINEIRPKFFELNMPSDRVFSPDSELGYEIAQISHLRVVLGAQS